jgi:hypothetical protein
MESRLRHGLRGEKEKLSFSFFLMSLTQLFAANMTAYARDYARGVD